MKLTVDTPAGQATIEAPGAWDKMTPLIVDGPGADRAEEWLQGTLGAYGHFIGEYAAPLDIHYAAGMQQENPHPGITIVKMECEPQEYSTGLPADAIV